MKQMILVLVTTLGLSVFAQATIVKVCDTANFGTATVVSTTNGGYELEFNGASIPAAYFEFEIQDNLVNVTDTTTLNVGERIVYTSMTFNGLTSDSANLEADHPAVTGGTVSFDLTQVRKIKMYDMVDSANAANEASGIFAVVDAYDGSDNYLGSIMGGGFFVGQCQ